jgi:TonB family protein
MKLLLFAFSFPAVLTACAQSYSRTETKTYALAQHPPQYPGGDKVLAKLLADSIDLPRVKWEEIEDDERNTYISLSFMVDEQGDVSDVKVIHSMNKVTDDKLVSLIKKLKFIPGTLDGKPVKMKYILPFNCDYLPPPAFR